MKKPQAAPYIINSISEMHRLIGLPKPVHPLVSVVNFDEVQNFSASGFKTLVYNFYSVCIKKDFKGKLKYGQHYYDFDEGIMTFLSPGQVITTELTDEKLPSGWWLIVHPDFLQRYSLGKTIKSYGYFSYAVNEALHLSEKEEILVTSIIKNIEQEYRSSIDMFSQDVIVAQIELLLHYCNRFYNRQFITRKSASNDLLDRVDILLEDYFNGNKIGLSGLPSVQYLSGELHVSSNYLSDMLRALTGSNTQQHIHQKLIDKAKSFLSTTALSVSEIAYQLGFEHPQSFSKLFKNKTSFSPLAFRQSFN